MRVCAAVLVAVVSASNLGAQAPAGSPVAPRDFESRAELVAAAAAAERQGRTSEAWLLKARLERGDFQEGDRIVLTMENNPVIDTLQVRAGKVVQFKGLPDFSLNGVLRAELTDTLRVHLSKFLRNPAIRATPLLPLSVMGNVGQGGYYYFAADMVLRDVIMAAGGPVNNANLDKVIIRRAGQTIWKADDVRIALADGLSLDRLHLRAGDEIFVPEQRRISAATVISVVSASTATILLLMQFLQN